MTLPPNFSETEHLQDAIRKFFNPRVRDYFRDINADDDISTDRGSLKRACLHQEKDPVSLTMLRLHLFDEVRGSVLQNWFLANNLPDSKYALEDLQESGKNHPKIILYFSQPEESRTKGKSAIPAETSFRVMGKLNVSDDSSKVIKESDLRLIGQRIKSRFENYRFTKGDKRWCYKDPSNGFFGSAVYCHFESEAEEIFKHLCYIAGTDFDATKIAQSIAPKKRSKTKPTGKVHGFDGKLKDENRWRPTVIVKFRYAIADCGLNARIPIYDTTGNFWTALVR